MLTTLEDRSAFFYERLSRVSMIFRLPTVHVVGSFQIETIVNVSNWRDF